MGNLDQLLKLKAFVNGLWVSSDKEISVLNPATGELIAKVPSCDRGILKEAVDGASNSFAKGS